MINLASSKFRSERLKAAREKALLSQEEAARKIDANRSAIGHWENGSVPELKDVELACALGMTPNEYLLAQPGLEDAAVQGLAPEDAAAAAEIIETLKMHRKEQPEGRKSPFLIVRDLLRMLSADLALPGVSVPAGTVVRKDSDLNLRAYTPTESGSSSTRGSRTADPLDALKVSEKKSRTVGAKGKVRESNALAVAG